MSQYRFKKNGFSVSLDSIDDYMTKILRLGKEAKYIATDSAREWGARTEMFYRSKISYGDGFRHSRYKGLTAFNDTEMTKSGFKVEVGHEHYVARFLEVGTKAHIITTERNGKKQEIYVKGITGSGALKKAIEEKLPELIDDISTALKNKID